MEYLLLVLILLPIAGALLSYLKPRTAWPLLLAEVLLVIVLCFFQPLELHIPHILISGLHLRFDGFRALYAFLTATAWLLSGLFSQEYGKLLHQHGRYYSFMLLTLAGTMGVFLSSNLMTTWICFEFMSFSSYVLVAHEEDAAALKAAGSYLTYGVIGGLAILMGLLLLYHQTGTLDVDNLASACATLSFTDLLPAGLCMLAGFGAKAGMFPLHTWLPAAHPVAPAPASALLSGIIVKTGIFGIALVTVNVFTGHSEAAISSDISLSVGWGNILLVLAVLTMVIGGLLALFSVNLKRTLACSSMSQMGFVIFGLACTSFLGSHSPLAASGAILHMVNHTLFKQVLFTLAGIVILNTGSLNLNDIKGFGKGKPLLMIAYLCAALGIGGIPLFSGYISKTLLHEGLVHYMASSPSGWYTAAEWLFLFSGGLTVAYMIKLFVVLFIDQPTKAYTPAQPENAHGSYMTKTTTFALLLPALALPIMGLLPHLTMDKIATGSLSFFGGGELSGIAYFSLENLKGGLISIAIGLFLYFVVVRLLLMKKGVYLDRWPKFIDLERFLYIPVFLRFLPSFFGGICRIICDLPDLIILFLRRTFFHEAKSHASPIAHHRFAYYLGSFLDRARENVEGYSEDPEKQHENAIAFARNSEAVTHTARQIFGSFSFSLIMACIGVGITLIYILVTVFL